MGSVSLCSLFVLGLEVHEIRVEVDVSPGLPAFHIVGLTDTVVQESKDRIRAALINSGFTFPRGKVVVNLAPASLPKTGSSFDLPIALGILITEGIVRAPLGPHVFLGELGLDGSIRKTDGVFLFATWAIEQKRNLYTSVQALPFARTRNTQSYTFGAHSLKELAMALTHNALSTLAQPSALWSTAPQLPPEVDFADIVGHQSAKRGLEIAAAGGHHVCLWGSPGTGKSMLAKALQGLMPPLTDSEWTEVQEVHCVRPALRAHQPYEFARPFRAPHHTISAAALIGGGPYPRPGEISLAHRGILFLDELAEFPRGHIDQLRQPLSEARITIGRAKHTCTFPAAFQLVGATNPCPCGYFGDLEVPCTCLETARKRYVGKLSGPVLDRIDVHMPIRRQALTLSAHTPTETSAAVQLRTIAARAFEQAHLPARATLSLKTIESFFFEPAALRTTYERARAAHYSPRSLLKLLSIARTIANLDACMDVKKPHLDEAWSFKTPVSR